MKPEPIGDSYPCLTVGTNISLKLIEPRILNHLGQFELVLEDSEMMAVLKVSMKYNNSNS